MQQIARRVPEAFQRGETREERVASAGFLGFGCVKNRPQVFFGRVEENTTIKVQFKGLVYSYIMLYNR